MDIRDFIRGGSVAATLLALAACSGDSGTSTGHLTIGLTDGPVDEANVHEVVVAFTGLELKPAGDGPPLGPFEFEPSSCNVTSTDPDVCLIDLLLLEGEMRELIFSDSVPAGNYEWIRLLVNAERNVMDSYLVTDQGTCALYIPSGAERGLQIINSITVLTDGSFDYTLDFDVRKSLTAPPGQDGTPDPATLQEHCAQNYYLKPVLRIVNTTEAGSIAGTVSAALFDPGSVCTLDGEGNPENAVVYVFADDGDPNTPIVADDIDDEDDGYPSPVTTATVKYNSDGPTYEYEAGFLAEGQYLAALTCTANADDPIANEFNPDSDPPELGEFSFIGDGIEVPVIAGETANGDFPQE